MIKLTGKEIKELGQLYLQNYTTKMISDRTGLSLSKINQTLRTFKFYLKFTLKNRLIRLISLDMPEAEIRERLGIPMTTIKSFTEGLKNRNNSF